jgi:aerobic carbon-monoxide dehydrogenase medium subunit
MYTMRPAAFDYHKPNSLDEAISLLGEGEARPLAGGHSLLPLMRLRLSTPSALVDLGGIPGLDGISTNGDGLAIGALATHRVVAESEEVRSVCPVLAETAEQIGDRQVRNRGTIGGSLAHADPGADYPTVLTALGASITAVGSSGERTIPAEDLFVGVFETSLETDEVITSVRVPGTGSGTGAAYVKHRHPASSFAVVGVAAVVTVEGDTCTAARIAVGGASGRPVLVPAAADALVGASKGDIQTAAAQAPSALTGATSDVYASGEYRQHLAEVLAGRALRQAFDRAS